MTSEPDTAPQMSNGDITDLRILVGMIVPESGEYGLPGADDPAIFSDILTSAAPHVSLIGVALQALNTISHRSQEARFVDLTVGQREGVTDTFREQNAAAAELLEALTVQCYYRDDRVKGSLNMDTRPPFPGGFELDQGDWSLLDNVKDRPAFYRNVDQTREI